jgi:uncharacterized protein (DUF2461 family)
MTFQGWPEEALEFYEGLEADNTKTYWTANKAIYDAKVLGPMTELLDELGPDFGETRMFRPYRDVRFSKDKTPYKTHIGGVIGHVRDGHGSARRLPAVGRRRCRRCGTGADRRRARG